jgi:hypothetical protein
MIPSTTITTTMAKTTQMTVEGDESRVGGTSANMVPLVTPERYTTVGDVKARRGWVDENRTMWHGPLLAFVGFRAHRGQSIRVRIVQYFAVANDILGSRHLRARI